MKASIRGLRSSLKSILNAVQQGQEVVIYSRNHAIAKIVPFKSAEASKKPDNAFGMWEDHNETTPVGEYIRKLRKGRKHDL